MTEGKPTWHEDSNGQLVKCPAKIKCRLGGDHYSGANSREAESNREKNLLGKHSMLSAPLVSSSTSEITIEPKYLAELPKSFTSYGQNLTVRPGEINEDAEFLFTHGQCHSLAAAIYEKTGWPIVKLSTDSGWSHCLAEMPSGQWLDIYGPQDADASFICGDDEVEDISEISIERFTDGETFLKNCERSFPYPHHEVATPFADELIARIEVIESLKKGFIS